MIDSHPPVVAIANRAEIAVRIAATCTRMGMAPVLLVSDEDVAGFAARRIGRVERIGPAGSETDVDTVIASATRAGADLLHPGYGFLSERWELAIACDQAGITFVGPSAETLSLCGDKVLTRDAATTAGVPLLPGSAPLDDDPSAWETAANAIGFPLLVKPALAGGGRGMRQVANASDLVPAIAAARREAAETGAGTKVFLERLLIEPRHVEVQLIGDGARAVAVGDRDCSLQRRHQKLIEEAPAPHLEPDTRARIHRYGEAIGRAVGLRGVGTAEFLFGQDGTIAFLEVNPRLQVEHTVTELTAGIDLVEWQFRMAAAYPLPTEIHSPRGHAIEARLYAEDPALGFLPSPGRLHVVSWPARPDLRVDTGFSSGDIVSSSYDPLVAKVVATGATRDSAIATLRTSLTDAVVAGVATNIPWLIAALDHPDVRRGATSTATTADISVPPGGRDFAIAAAVARTLDKPDSDDPWNSIGPLRIAGESSLLFHGDDWEMKAVMGASSHGTTVRIGDSSGDEPLQWWRDADGSWTISWAGTIARVGFADLDGMIEVAGHGHRVLLRAGPRAQIGLSSSASKDGRVRAPMPGKVLRVDVEEGDRVQQGDVLVVLSAMKIELGCSAPFDGMVSSVNCAQDSLVEANQLLVEMVPDGASTAGETVFEES